MKTISAPRHNAIYECSTNLKLKRGKNEICFYKPTSLHQIPPATTWTCKSSCSFGTLDANALQLSESEAVQKVK